MKIEEPNSFVSRNFSWKKWAENLKFSKDFMNSREQPRIQEREIRKQPADENSQPVTFCHRLKIITPDQILREGGIIAYPTEAVFGFGCDPFNETAVLRLLKIKNRPIEMGLILVAANWEQIKPLIDFKKLGSGKEEILKNIRATWPGPITWIFPATKKSPHWIIGKHNSVAIRISAHPVVKSLCKKFGGPIVSTSANIAGESPVRTYKEVCKKFSNVIDFIVDAKVGNLKKSTVICDAVSGIIIRP